MAGLLTPVALAAPAYADTVCDAGDFEIDGNLTAGDCAPGFDDWSNVLPSVSTQGGTYSSAGKDISDPTDWVSSGQTPNKGTFQTVYSHARVVDGDYWLFVGWDRDSNTGTGSYAIEVTAAAARTGANGVPQPDRSNGGAVFYLEMNGAALPVFEAGCVYGPLDYASDPNAAEDAYHANCSDDETGYVSQINPDDGKFFEVGINMTERADIEPDCPPSLDAAAVYVRSITGQASGSGGNLKAYMAPLEVIPPTTCGTLSVAKHALGNVGVPSDTVFGYTVGGLESEALDGELLIDETDVDPNVEPGEYTLTEQIPEGAPWSQVSIVCTITGGEPIELTGPDDTFPVEEGKSTACVIVNATSFVDVSKATVPAGITDEFTFDLNGEQFSLAGGKTSGLFQFAPGTEVVIGEAEAEGWALTDIVCEASGEESDPGESIDLEARTTTFDTIAAETVSCTFTNATSWITVEKETIPDGSEQQFDFTIGEEEFPLADGESQTFQFEPGTEVKIDEVIPDGWALTNTECSVPPAGESETGLSVTSVAGETVTCTFTNTLLGTIIVHKVVDPAQAADFPFTSESLGDFTITTDEEGMGTETFTHLVPGSYDVTEPQELPFDTTDLVCVDPSEDTEVDLESWTAAIELSAGETVECTYTNTERGMILVDKDTLPANVDQDFEFVFDGEEPFTLNDATDDEEDLWSSGDLEPGTYTVSETVPGDWRLTSISCGTRNASTTTVELEAGAVVTCTFVNQAPTPAPEPPATLTVTKSAEGGDGTFEFTLTPAEGDPVTGSVTTVGGEGEFVFEGVAIGEGYSIAETNLPSGWEAGPMSCTVTGAAGGEPVVIDPSDFEALSGDEIACEITNTLRPAMPATGASLAALPIGLGLLLAGGLVFGFLQLRRRRLGGSAE